MTEVGCIVSFCKENRVSTTEVTDALGKTGLLPRVSPVNPNLHRVGPIRCIFAANNSNWDVHEQIKTINEGDVVIIFASNCDPERAIIGELVAKYLLLYRRAAAIVVQGPVRDASAIRREGYPIWSYGLSPLGCFNYKADPFPKEHEDKIRDTYEGGIAICDDGGVAIMKRSILNKDMLRRLKQIEMQEDIWFFCLDTLKWDTKKIVCDKAYLKEKSLLSRVHIEQLSELESRLDE